MVYAIIALIVLVVLIMIFSGNLGNQNDNLNKCITQGGTCRIASECVDGKTEKAGEYGDCIKKEQDNPGTDYVCCVGFF